MDTVVEMVPVQGGSWRENRYTLIPRSRANSKEKGAPDATHFFGGTGDEESVGAGSEFSDLGEVRGDGRRRTNPPHLPACTRALLVEAKQRLTWR